MKTEMTNSNFYNHNIATEISELHDLGLMAWNDTSSNDVCDSIAFYSKDKSTKVKIFVPNADITDIEQEMFHTFSIQIFIESNDFLLLNDSVLPLYKFDENEESFNGCEFYTWNEVLEFIKSQNF